ncbi:MAG: DUF6249 domain-containing protein [Lysobacter spongiicola]|nr:DUF6249 domain-containing protein [Lysobacter spongiicola]
MYDIIAILLPVVFAVCIVVAIRIVVEARLRRRLAETHASEELLQSMLLADAENRRQSSFKWGLVMVLLGFALAAVDLLGLSVDDPSAFGLLFAAIGAGLIGYYAATRRTPPRL